MPWCEPCSKYLAPSAVNADGSCPSCGEQVGEVEKKPAGVVADESTPWHFKMLVVMLVIYLGWRFVQLLT
jgi:hypothetical protein